MTFLDIDFKNCRFFFKETAILIAAHDKFRARSDVCVFECHRTATILQYLLYRREENCSSIRVSSILQSNFEILFECYKKKYRIVKSHKKNIYTYICTVYIPCYDIYTHSGAPCNSEDVNIILAKLYITIKKNIVKWMGIPVNNCSQLCMIFLKWYTIAIVKKL